MDLNPFLITIQKKYIANTSTSIQALLLRHAKHMYCAIIRQTWITVRYRYVVGKRYKKEKVHLKPLIYRRYPRNEFTRQIKGALHEIVLR